MEKDNKQETAKSHTEYENITNVEDDEVVSKHASEYEKEKQNKKSMLRVTIGIIIVVIVLFALVCLFTGFLGTIFGKSGEMIGLVTIAIVLLVMFIRTKRS